MSLTDLIYRDLGITRPGPSFELRCIMRRWDVDRKTASRFRRSRWMNRSVREMLASDYPEHVRRMEEIADDLATD